ncbi:MAG TPA: DUF6677 family protein [Bryobacteraceae bacterium]
MATKSNAAAPAAVKPTPVEVPDVPVSKWLPPVLLGWLIPGGGHFLLRKHARGGLLAFAVIFMFLSGIMMRGATFQKPFFDMMDSQQPVDLLTKVINTGGFIGNIMTGLPYLMTAWFSYDQPDVAGHVHDYGTKFLVAAGLLNILALVDVFEIATRKKD